jgi:hypothetical protein
MGNMPTTRPGQTPKQGRGFCREICLRRGFAARSALAWAIVPARTGIFPQVHSLAKARKMLASLRLCHTCTRHATWLLAEDCPDVCMTLRRYRMDQPEGSQTQRRYRPSAQGGMHVG